MNSLKAKIIIPILLIGLLSACGSGSAGTPASSPTDEIVSVTEAPSNPQPATDTPPTDTAQPTEVPTEEPTLEPAPATVSFANDIVPILQSRCLNCHGGERIEEGLKVNTHADLMAGSDNGLVIIPGDASNSLFVELIVNNKMPKRGPKLTPPQVQLIIDWINQGALDN
ncbi:MAG: hypothetical protein C3F07_16695 [Anaerolineales bacterium]|nr:hypothetical protein [Anaerolineae bacterium]PWB70473.1 MAG: hypothetical protein C3F07_16695 [Anaerolineales bacterium]